MRNYNREKTAKMSAIGIMLVLAVVLLPFSFQASDADPCTTYTATTNIIRVKCNIDWPAVAALNPTKIINEGNGVYLVKSTVQLDALKTMNIQTPDVTWLKLTGINGIRGIGFLSIDGVKITSWSTVTNSVIQQNVAGSISRGWIYASVGAGVLDIRNSEIGYLGQALSAKQGIAIYRQNNTQLVNNTIHHNFYGVYSSGASGILAENNTLTANILYGFDPHTGTHDSVFRNNYITGTVNGIGLICSLDCYNILFEDNTITNSKTGIMFSRNMHDSIARNNTIIGTLNTAISVSESPNNLIENNHLFNNYYGIVVKFNGCNYNELVGNDIHNTLRDGIQIRLECVGTLVHDNLLDHSKLVNKSTTTTMYNNTIV